MQRCLNAGYISSCLYVSLFDSISMTEWLWKISAFCGTVMFAVDCCEGDALTADSLILLRL